MIINLKRFKSMVKKSNETAIKCRQTKLEKKSYEELVQIILKKDNIERNLNKQIVNLKSEVNTLNTRIKGFEKDCAGDINIIETLRTEVKHLNESIRTKNEQIDAANIQVNANHDKYVKEHAICNSLKSKCDYYKKLMWIFALVCALSCSAFISVII